MTKQFDDSLFFHDDITAGGKSHNCGLWARTEVVIRYDYKDNPTGKSSLGEVLFTGENMVTIGGVQYAMEQLFGVKGYPEIMSNRTLHETPACDGADDDKLEIGLENNGYPIYDGEVYKTYIDNPEGETFDPTRYKALMKYSGETYQVPRVSDYSVSV